MADWATDPNDDSAGRRFLRLGQDLPLYATTLKVTASVTKLKFLVSPENSYAEFYAQLNAATQSIKIAGYEYSHPDIIALLPHFLMTTLPDYSPFLPPLPARTISTNN